MKNWATFFPCNVEHLFKASNQPTKTTTATTTLSRREKYVCLTNTICMFNKFVAIRISFISWVHCICVEECQSNQFNSF